MPSSLHVVHVVPYEVHLHAVFLYYCLSVFLAPGEALRDSRVVTLVSAILF